jgi:predicted membrane GTPase involved in stress response
MSLNCEVPILIAGGRVGTIEEHIRMVNDRLNRLYDSLVITQEKCEDLRVSNEKLNLRIKELEVLNYIACK